LQIFQPPYALNALVTDLTSGDSQNFEVVGAHGLRSQDLHAIVAYVAAPAKGQFLQVLQFTKIVEAGVGDQIALRKIKLL
jgi:hypothetical protein